MSAVAQSDKSLACINSQSSRVPSNLPEGVRKLPANVEQMRAIFEGWDPRLNAIIRETKNDYRWQLLHMKELDTWTKGSVALLGGACHPTLPYQAQGAAMAVEDGATIGKLLGLYAESRSSGGEISIAKGPAVVRRSSKASHNAQRGGSGSESDIVSSARA